MTRPGAPGRSVAGMGRADRPGMTDASAAPARSSVAVVGPGAI
ncbi:SAM-dependent methyltransferase, partial [Clavibacter phaseoli]